MLAEMPAKACRVSFKDCDGIVHSVEVTADGLYEAACCGLRALKHADWVDRIGPGTRISVEVQGPTVQHFVMYAQLTRWLDGGARNAAEALKKKQLKEILAG